MVVQSLTFWQHLAMPMPAKIEHERRRGRANAKDFLASNPTDEDKAHHYRMSQGIGGDSPLGAAYDRGYHDVLSQHMNDPDGMPDA